MYSKHSSLPFRPAPARTRAAVFLICALLCAACYAIDAKVTDVSGRTYDVNGVRLAKGSALDVNCGGVRVKVPFKRLKSMKVNPAKITSIDGKLHFSAELLLIDSVVIGNTESGGRCYVPAGNGLRGKSSKAKIEIPFDKLGYVYILGKEDKEKKEPAGGGKEQPVADGGNPAAGDEVKPSADNEEKQPGDNEERRTEE